VGDACGANGLESSVGKVTEEDRTSQTAPDGPSVRQTVLEDIPPNNRALKLHTGLLKAESSVLVQVQARTGRIRFARCFYSLHVSVIQSAKCGCGGGEEPHET
jgi:hypothetical protein